MARFPTTPPETELPRADDHAAGHADGAQAPTYPGIPEGLPTIPVEEFASRLPGEMPEETGDHLPDFFGPF